MKKREYLRVLCNDKLITEHKNNLHHDFNYYAVDKETYLLAKKNNYIGNISVYFINKEGKEYGFTITKMENLEEV